MLKLKAHSLGRRNALARRSLVLRNALAGRWRWLRMCPQDRALVTRYCRQRQAMGISAYDEKHYVSINFIDAMLVKAKVEYILYYAAHRAVVKNGGLGIFLPYATPTYHLENPEFTPVHDSQKSLGWPDLMAWKLTGGHEQSQGYCTLTQAVDFEKRVLDDKISMLAAYRGA